MSHDILIVGGGAAGIAVASSLLAREATPDIALIDPADQHYYQPGWTMVGGGIFDAGVTAKTMSGLMPKGVQWIKAVVTAFEPERNAVRLDNGEVITYQRQIDGQKPSKLAWMLKERLLPPVHWRGMLWGREWMAKPSKRPASPAAR